MVMPDHDTVFTTSTSDAIELNEGHLSQDHEARPTTEIIEPTVDCRALVKAAREMPLSPPAKVEALAPPGEIKRRLGLHFNKVTQEMPIACNQELKDAPNPFLSITGFGKVGFPLGPEDINRIKAASGQSDSESLQDAINVDLAAPGPHRSWEVPGTLWEARNPAWEIFLQSICDKVEDGLRIQHLNKGVALKPSCMILYEPGSRVAPSSNPSCFSALTFGTLDIALLTEGGDVSHQFMHDETTLGFPRLETSEFDCSLTAWDRCLPRSIFS
ncbi:uncharacterized protein LY89DRAFT_369158 [Mollisia scopiformis]|uniref:Uncharacterized protein n=1 Tax=Mollisia scopiformis TaxID=149040 RepID=A0A132B652_MOLSC|nr:uncharacterized protein LY89DRAFT_369158 [Mollisia scopiformis]KUJ07147.1 hypothetical protein LY89DRAFT_369158 [Mollisia scopiformis]